MDGNEAAALAGFGSHQSPPSLLGGVELLGEVAPALAVVSVAVGTVGGELAQLQLVPVTYAFNNDMQTVAAAAHSSSSSSK